MKILIVNTSRAKGGAAVAANRLAKALKNCNMPDIDCSMFTLDDIDAPKWRKFLAKAWERGIIWFHNGLSLKNLWTVSIANTGFDITETKAFKEADIIHLHWINQGFLSMKSVKNIIYSKKPIVWTMHDMWPLTGICHHSKTCTSFTNGCGNCPLLRFPSKKDISYSVFHKKLALFADANIHFTVVSNWLKEKAEQSALMKGKDITVIPNPISLNDFNILDKQECRKEFNLPNKNIIVFGAAKLDDPFKGAEMLFEALQKVADNGEQVHLVLFGNIKGDKEKFLSQIPVDYTFLGQIDTPKLNKLLSAADVLVSSSLYETFGQTLIEAQACGCIPVSFGNSGQKDIIEHKRNGYLAEYLNTDDLAAGINWALTEGKQTITPENLRANVAAKYSEQIIAQQFIDLYSKL